ncbi:hypothetical protein M2324_003787 [Rhodovulum sulfidophilum]|uniref:hypothetical protein n=1 Tax=Rhodovulum sulfidophilum TaxID=35806 RepID=UPI0005AA0B30|nr:hypothetical protein [Rhodovulum sulfidophilum]MCW2305365.1 hypothetical protein [Rhodovulum sulfidophilum]
MTQATYLLDTGHTKAQAFAMLQGALSAIQSGNAGATPPAETAAGMVWVDTDAHALKMRNIANNGWITLGSFASGNFVPAGVNQLTEAQAKDALSDIYGAVTGQILAAAIDARVRATGAPVNEAVWHPYDMVRVGDGADGLFWDHSLTGNQRYVQTPAFEDGYEYMLRIMGMEWHGYGNKRPTIKGFIEQTGRYASAMAMAGDVEPSTGFHVMIRLLFPRVPSPFFGIEGKIPSGQIRTSTLGGNDRTVSRAEISWADGDTDIRAGKMYLYRRREYISG